MSILLRARQEHKKAATYHVGIRAEREPPIVSHLMSESEAPSYVSNYPSPRTDSANPGPRKAHKESASVNLCPTIAQPRDETPHRSRIQANKTYRLDFTLLSGERGDERSEEEEKER